MQHTAQRDSTRRRAQAGNVFIALFGAVALVGLLGYGTTQFVRGPLTSATTVTRVNMAETQMMLASQVSVMTAVQGAGSGDCDSDGYVEPLRYRDAGSATRPTGGGYLPSNIGINTLDPWGTEFGYCVWDHGSATLQPACQDAGADRRLAGANSGAHSAIAVISAGRDKRFQTTCSAFVDTTPADGNPDTPLVAKTTGSDDLILKYTYAEANGMGAGLWSLKTGDPDVATINKDLEVTGGATFSGPLSFSSGGLVMPDQVALATCNAGNLNQIRRNTTTSPPTLQICWNNGGTYEWGDISGSGGGGGGGAATPGGANPQVQYNDNGVFGGDSAFIWSETNDRLGLGAATPQATIDMGVSTAGQKLLIHSNGNNRYGLGYNMSGGTFETNLFAASDGTNGHISFGFVDSANGTTYAEGMRLTEGGRLGIGVTAPDAPLEVAGEVILGNTSLGCSGSTEGALRYNASTDQLQFCNGTAWGDVDASAAAVTAAGADGQVQYNDNGNMGGDANFIWDDVNDRLGIGRATPVVALDINGALRVGSDATACSSTIAGAIRYDSTDRELEYCNSTDWVSISGTSDTGTAPTATTGMGYFVLSSGTTNGNMGGFSGANTWCYNDLNTNNWNGKTDATTRGIFTPANVQAFLGDPLNAIQQYPLPNTTYIFARSGNASYGGATFTADASGYGPGNTQFWSGTNYFGGSFEYWTGTNVYSTLNDLKWGATEPISLHCSEWTLGTSANGTYYGHTNSNNSYRWFASGGVVRGCNSTMRVICMVHP